MAGAVLEPSCAPSAGPVTGCSGLLSQLGRHRTNWHAPWRHVHHPGTPQVSQRQLKCVQRFRPLQTRDVPATSNPRPGGVPQVRESASSRENCLRWQTRIGFGQGGGSKQQTRRQQVMMAAPSPSFVQALPAVGMPTLPRMGPLRDLAFASLGAAMMLLAAVVVVKWWQKVEKFVNGRAPREAAALPEPAPLGQKESVEWVNMVLHKIWKIYRRSIENWIVGLLQPAIDKLHKPEYIKRVEIAEFSLDYEPLSVRNVQRRASRRANDVQYQIGLRYTGGARCLLQLHLTKYGVSTEVPVGVYDLDVDGELWVKIRLAPIKPYVGTVSLAFVSAPTIKLVLAPFRLVNLFAVPFLSSFLTQLLTVDLPKLYVLPRRINFDFIPHEHSFASHLVEAVRASAEQEEGPMESSKTYVGELTVTLCEAKDLPIGGIIGWSNPHCTLALGTQFMESKRNSETSTSSGHRNPVWNQDFVFLVEDPYRQHLVLKVKDSTLTLKPNIGFCMVPIWKLEDCVPNDVWVPLKREGPFGVTKVQGQVRLLLTYKSFVDADSDIGEEADKTESLQQTIRIYSEGTSKEAVKKAADTAVSHAEKVKKDEDRPKEGVKGDIEFAEWERYVKDREDKDKVLFGKQDRHQKEVVVDAEHKGGEGKARAIVGVDDKGAPGKEKIMDLHGVEISKSKGKKAFTDRFEHWFPKKEARRVSNQDNVESANNHLEQENVNGQLLSRSSSENGSTTSHTHSGNGAVRGGVLSEVRVPEVGSVAVLERELTETRRALSEQFKDMKSAGEEPEASAASSEEFEKVEESVQQTKLLSNPEDARAAFLWALATATVLLVAFAHLNVQTGSLPPG